MGVRITSLLCDSLLSHGVDAILMAEALNKRQADSS